VGPTAVRVPWCSRGYGRRWGLLRVGGGGRPDALEAETRGRMWKESRPFRRWKLSNDVAGLGTYAFRANVGGRVCLLGRGPAWAVMRGHGCVG